MTSSSSLEFIKFSDFNSLSLDVNGCTKCQRMCNSSRILGLSSGSLNAKIMFIGEAPGRLGADETGIPFHGDKAGDNFEALLDFVGITRDDIFVTNSVLCNPKDEVGNNSPPTVTEIQNCTEFLIRQINLINPSLIVTLGANALKATSLIEQHNLVLKSHVRTQNNWFYRKLIPLYHPGQRAMLHRSFANQRSDYQFVADALKHIGHNFKKINGYTSDAVKTLVESILKSRREVSYFALHKLAYLLEWDYAKSQGQRLTGAYFIRQKDGPYCTDLHLSKLKNSIHGLKITKNKDRIFLSVSDIDLFDNFTVDDRETIPDFVNSKIIDLLGKSDAELKTSAYMTRPMRDILIKERSLSMNMYNSPIKFFN